MIVLICLAAYILIGFLFVLVGTVVLEKRGYGDLADILLPCGVLWPFYAPFLAAYAAGMYIARKLSKGGAGNGKGK